MATKKATKASAPKKSAASKGATAKTEASNSSTTNEATASSSQEEATLETLFEDLLKDTYSAEKQLVEALPKMANAADSPDLEDAFETHLEETKKHVERLNKIFEKLRIDKGEEEECEAMKGLIEEAEEVISKYSESPVRDSALIICAQKVEHYEIAAYGSLCELADVLGWQKIHDLLGRTLEEEEETDDILTEIAVEVNDSAYELSEDYHGSM